MSIVGRLAAAVTIGGLVTGGVLALNTPAGALGGSVTCDPQTINHVNYALCSLTLPGNPSNSRWTYNGAAQTWANNLNDVKFACGAKGVSWLVGVTFTDSTGHFVGTSRSGICGGMAN